MVDYQAIAAADPGGDLETAYATLAAQTTQSTPEVMLTYKQVAAKVSLAASAELQAAVIANTPEWVDAALKAEGVNVNDVQVAAVLGSIVSAETATGITAMGVIDTPVFNGLKIGHLANARQKVGE